MNDKAIRSKANDIAKKRNEMYMKRGENQPSTKPADETVINDVWNGKYGSGKEREEKLRQAGYDPVEVQSKINESPRGKQEVANRQKIPETETEGVPSPTMETNTESTPDSTEANADANEGDSFLSGTDIPEEAKQQIEGSDEGQNVKDAVESGDPSKLQNITTPEGEGVLGGSYDNNGRYVPKVYNPSDAQVFKNKNFALALTLVSWGVSAISAMYGVPLPPMDFVNMTRKTDEEYINAMNENEKNYASLINEPKKEGDTAYETGSAETQVQSEKIDTLGGKDKKAIDTTASAVAATGGSNTQKDVNAQQNQFEMDLAKYNGDLQKYLADQNVDLAKWQTTAANNQQQIMANLQNTFDLSKMGEEAKLVAKELPAKILAMREAGLSEKDIQSYVMNALGESKVDRYIKRGTDIAGAAGNLISSVGSLIPGGGKKDNSDKNCKSFAKSANDRMFSKRRR